MTHEQFTSLPFSVKLNKLLLEAEYIGSCKISDNVLVIYLMEACYYEILYSEDMNNIIHIKEAEHKHLAHFCDFELSLLL